MSILFPPGLHVSIIVGVLATYLKLKNKKITCHSFHAIMSGAFVDMVCFDKTGTLTEPKIRLSELILVK